MVPGDHPGEEPVTDNTVDSGSRLGHPFAFVNRFRQVRISLPCLFPLLMIKGAAYRAFVDYPFSFGGRYT
jgi:hypothetical protein